MESPHGCPELQTGGLNKHNKIWWWLNGVLMMVLGLFFLGVGARAPLISMFLAVTIILGTCMTLGMYVFVFPGALFSCFVCSNVMSCLSHPIEYTTSGTLNL